MSSNSFISYEDKIVELFNKTRTKKVIKRIEPKKEEPKIDEKTGKRIRKKQEPLKPYYMNIDNDLEYLDIFKSLAISNKIQIQVGIDEAGRGPMFGRVYAAATILPLEGFEHNKIKDSKKFSSKKKLMEIYNYIKENALAYSVCYEDEDTIDEINIRQSTLKAMNRCLKEINEIVDYDFILVDGCDFYNLTNKGFVCIEGGDNLYTPIAAASILAKVERDLYIEKLCEENPELDEKYGILKNKGYGTKKHLDGIRNYGITKWHRKTFGICKNY